MKKQLRMFGLGQCLNSKRRFYFYPGLLPSPPTKKVTYLKIGTFLRKIRFGNNWVIHSDDDCWQHLDFWKGSVIKQLFLFWSLFLQHPFLDFQKTAPVQGLDIQRLFYDLIARLLFVEPDFLIFRVGTLLRLLLRLPLKPLRSCAII